jgi:hypothetical protein
MPVLEIGAGLAIPIATLGYIVLMSMSTTSATTRTIWKPLKGRPEHSIEHLVNRLNKMPRKHTLTSLGLVAAALFGRFTCAASLSYDHAISLMESSPLIDTHVDLPQILRSLSKYSFQCSYKNGPN